METYNNRRERERDVADSPVVVVAVDVDGRRDSVRRFRFREGGWEATACACVESAFQISKFSISSY